MKTALLALLTFIALPACATDMDSLLAQCASSVHPSTMKAIIKVESGGNPIALNINNGPRVRATNPTEAAHIAHEWIARGYSVDLGLAQINSRNLPKLGESVESILDPCRNLSAGARVLGWGYERAKATFGEGQKALAAAISTYNTGSLTAGFGNGYVGKVMGALGLSIPALPAGFTIAKSQDGVLRLSPQNSPLAVIDSETSLQKTGGLPTTSTLSAW
jgi:type IV secretion system protein VirB1